MRIGVLSVWGCQITWNYSYKRLWAVTWVLGIEPGISGRAATALDAEALQLLLKTETMSYLFLHLWGHTINMIKNMNLMLSSDLNHIKDIIAIIDYSYGWWCSALIPVLQCKVEASGSSSPGVQCGLQSKFQVMGFMLEPVSVQKIK